MWMRVLMPEERCSPLTALEYGSCDNCECYLKQTPQLDYVSASRPCRQADTRAIPDAGTV